MGKQAAGLRAYAIKCSPHRVPAWTFREANPTKPLQNFQILHAAVHFRIAEKLRLSGLLRQPLNIAAHRRTLPCVLP